MTLRRYLYKILDQNNTDDDLLDEFRNEYASQMTKFLDTVLLRSIKSGRIKLFRSFLLQGIHDINHVDLRGNSVMTYAMKQKQDLLCLEIIQNGYNRFDLEINGSSLNKYAKDSPYLAKTFVRMTELHATPTNVISRFQFFEPYEFESLKKIGSGGNGVVFVSKNKEDGKYYALKREFDDPENITNFVTKEIMISRTLNKNHNIVPMVYGIYRDKHDQRYIVMDLLVEDLKSWFKKYEGIKLELKRDLFIKMFRKIFSIVHDFHSLGFFHSDLKPENIMIDQHGEVKIIDFGLTDYLGLTVKTSFLCTYAYKAPDDSKEKYNYYLNGRMIRKASEKCIVTYSTDVFSVAVIILNAVLESKGYQLLFWKNDIFYYERKNTSNQLNVSRMSKDMEQKIEKFSPHLMDLLLKCFHTDSEIRYSCKEALQHPFFGSNSKCVSNYYHDVSPPLRSKDVSSMAISLNLGIVKYYKSIMDTLGQLVIPKNSKSMTYSSSSIDSIYLNWLLIKCYMNNNKISEPNLESQMTGIENLRTIIDDDFALVEPMVQRIFLEYDTQIIDFETIKQGHEISLRKYGCEYYHLVKFDISFYNMFEKFLSAKRDQEVTIREVLETMTNLIRGDPIFEAYEWISDILK